MVLVQANTLNFQRCIIEEKPLGRIETRRAETASRGYGIEAGLALHQAGFNCVKVRCVDAPQFWRRNLKRQVRYAQIEGGDDKNCLRGRHRGTAGVSQRADGRDGPVGLANSVGDDLDRDRPFAIRHHRVGKHAVGDDVHRIALDDAHRAIQSAALVPPPFHGLGVDTDRQGVERLAIGDQRRQVSVDAVIPAPIMVD